MVRRHVCGCWAGWSRACSAAALALHWLLERLVCSAVGVARQLLVALLLAPAP